MNHSLLSLPVKLAGTAYESAYDLMIALLGMTAQELAALTYWVTNRPAAFGATKLGMINRLLGCASR